MISTAQTNAAKGTTIAQVFRQHGISIAYGAPIMQIQELAMAINLVGRHHVHVDYRTCCYAHGGHELGVMHKPRETTWTDGSHHLQALLPSVNSTEEQRGESITALQSIVNALEDLLQEGEPS